MRAKEDVDWRSLKCQSVNGDNAEQAGSGFGNSGNLNGDDPAVHLLDFGEVVWRGAIRGCCPHNKQGGAKDCRNGKDACGVSKKVFHINYFSLWLATLK